jgi:hypothetical protein
MAERNRLSTIDLLPAEAEPDVAWAIAELEAGNRHQKDIWAEFNARLADRGIGPVSHSTFGRYALRKRRAFARLREVREISTALTNALEPGGDDDLTVAVAQLIKTAAFEVLESGGKFDARDLESLGKALQATQKAMQSSASRRQADHDQVAKKAGDAVAAIAREAGLSKERIGQLRREFLGIRPSRPE